MPIAILNYRYNYIKPNTISDDLYPERAFYLSNNKLYDTPIFVGGSPFGESTLFAAATLAANSNQSHINFSIPSNLYLTNQTAALQSIEIDLGDGQGYRNTALGGILSADYTSNGLKILKIQVTLNNGTVLQSHTTIDVNDPLNTNTPDGPHYDYSSKPNTTKLTEVGNNFAKLNIFYHCPNRGLRKPFIFIEGFNPSELLDQNWQAMSNRLTDVTNLTTLPKTSMWQRLYDEGYDLIYVDFKDGAGDIPQNAQLVKQVIRDINALKHQSGSTEKTRVLGASMGGIVGKWALREMEMANEAHEVDKFITFDSPLALYLPNFSISLLQPRTCGLVRVCNPIHTMQLRLRRPNSI